MRRIMEGCRRLWSLLRRAELERGLDEEIRFHIESQTDKNLRAGMAPDEARRQALITFGGVELARESTRDQLRFASIEECLRDLRHAGRALLRAPGFAVVTILTLALGIGATTAMFSVVNGILLRPLPFPEQDRLIELVHEAPGAGLPTLLASPAIYFTYRDHSRAFESVGLFDSDRSPVTVTGSGQPEAVQSLEVTHEVLGILGANPILGRGFSQTDDLPESTPTAIISYSYWRRHFGGASPLGQTLVVDGIVREVIGVLPQWFRFFDYPADLFYPLQPVRSAARFPSFDGRGIARLKDGVTLQAANDDVTRMIPILSEEFGGWRSGGFRPRLRLLKDSVVGDLGETLWLLMGTIGLLLLIACANVSNLVLVRTQSRRPELAIRTALGAGWAAVARVVVSESAILGVAGGVAGVAVAYYSLPLLLSLGATNLPDIMTVAIDPTVLLVALGASIAATVMFALVPVFHSAFSRLQVTDELRGGARSITEGQGNRTRRVLVIVQVALALVLLIGSGLMIRTFVTLRQVDPGFRDPADVLTFQLTIPATAAPATERGGVSSPEQAVRMQHAVLERLAAVPGVASAGFSAFDDGLPLDGDGRQNSFFVEGRTRVDGVASLKENQFVSPGFVETLQTRVIAGRMFDWSDVYDNHRVVLVSENLARTQWGSAGAALRARVSTRPTGPWWDVVGVIADVHHNGLGQPAPETVIFPVIVAPSPISVTSAWRTASFVVRTGRIGTTGFLDDVHRAVWSVNANLSVANVRTLGDLYQRSMARTTMTLQLLAITGTMALTLGLVGIYGIVSYAVSQRRREIGIRVALGAGYGEVRRMFVRHTLVLVAIGIAIGLGAALGLTRLMESQLFGVSPLDPLTHLSVAVLLLAAAGLASYLSARRTSALDPVEVLKGE